MNFLIYKLMKKNSFGLSGNVRGVSEMLGGFLFIEAPLVVSLLGLLSRASSPSLVSSSCVKEWCWWLDVLAEEVAGGWAEGAGGTEEFLESQDSSNQKSDFTNDEGLDDEETKSTEEDWHQSEEFYTDGSDQGEDDLLYLATTWKNIYNRYHRSISKLVIEIIDIFLRYSITFSFTKKSLFPESKNKWSIWIPQKIKQQAESELTMVSERRGFTPIPDLSRTIKDYHATIASFHWLRQIKYGIHECNDIFFLPSLSAREMDSSGALILRLWVLKKETAESKSIETNFMVLSDASRGSSFIISVSDLRAFPVRSTVIQDDIIKHQLRITTK